MRKSPKKRDGFLSSVSLGAALGLGGAAVLIMFLLATSCIFICR